MKLFFPGLLPLLFVGVAAGCRPATPRPVDPSFPGRCVAGRTFLLLRHAEKATSDKDTPLSDRGRERAARVAALLAETRLTRLVASKYRRTQETLAPLAEQRGVPVEVGPATEKEALLAELRKAPDGAAVVVATHSDVLPYVVRELGKTPLRGVEGDTLPESDFGRLAIVTLPCEGAPIVVELSTGP